MNMTPKLHCFITPLLLLCALCVICGSTAQAQDARFQRFDKNADGKVSREEAKGTAAEARFDDLDKNKDGFLTPEEVPRRRPAAPTPADHAAPAIVTQMDIRYAEMPPGVDANLLSLDVYAPKDATNLPVMIYIHGGGWRRGDKLAVGDKPNYFTARGFVFVSLNYRVVPGVDILTQLQDSADAIGWVRTNIAKHGGDPTRLHLIGHSAGAHHVAILATNERFLQNAGVALSDLKSVVELDTQALDVPELMRGSDNDLYSQAFGKDSTVWKQVSPGDNVAEGKGIPPFFLVVADNRQQKLDQATAFQKALQAAGVRCEFVEAPQHDHGSLNRAIGDTTDKVTQAMEKFHDSIATPKKSAAATETDDPFTWEPSLTFDAETMKEGPLPVNAMQLVTHRGTLFCGMATSFERDRHSRSSSYIYSKSSSREPWKLEADFGPGTSRIGDMLSVRFEHDAAGKPIPGGPQDVLVAFTMSLTRRGVDPAPLQVRVRDDATGKWHTHDLPAAKVADANVRTLCAHRDRVTGADLLFVGANPAPQGIFAGTYDAGAPARIRWGSEPEIEAQGRRGTSKWFGMAVVNGVLLASDVDSVYRRLDGPQPRWIKVHQFPRGVGDEGGAAVRGLTSARNPQTITGWTEPDMLLCATQMKLWSLRIPADPETRHDIRAELALIPWLGERLSDPVIFAESAFNPPCRFTPSPGAAPVWPIGFQVVYPVPGKNLSNSDPDSFRLKEDAWFLLRNVTANYTLHRIESDHRLFLARDFEPSPFADEPHTLYACGYNGSYFKGSLGTAWIYKGTQSAK